MSDGYKTEKENNFDQLTFFPTFVHNHVTCLVVEKEVTAAWKLSGTNTILRIIFSAVSSEVIPRYISIYSIARVKHFLEFNTLLGLINIKVTLTENSGDDRAGTIVQVILNNRK